MLVPLNVDRLYICKLHYTQLLQVSPVLSLPECIHLKAVDFNFGADVAITAALRETLGENLVMEIC